MDLHPIFKIYIILADGRLAKYVLMRTQPYFRQANCGLLSHLRLYVHVRDEVPTVPLPFVTLRVAE